MRAHGAKQVHRVTRILVVWLAAAVVASPWSAARGADLDLKRPMGGELYVSGNYMTVQWTLTLEEDEYANTVELYYAWGGETEQHHIASVGTDIFDRTYRWRVPDVKEMSFLRIIAYAEALDLPTLDRDTSLHVKIIPDAQFPAIYLVKPQPICNASAEDCFPPVFLRPGDVYYITWSVSGCIVPYLDVPLQIQFSSNGGLSYESVATVPSACANPVYPWRVPDTETEHGKIRLIWGTLDSSTCVHSFGIAAAPDINHPPTASAGENQTVPEGSLVTLDGTGSSDPDPGDTLTYRWVRTDAAIHYDIDLRDASTARASFVAPEVTTSSVLFVFALTVTDPDGASDTDVVEVTVTPGGPRITRFSPAEGWYKKPVTIFGSNLSGGEIFMHGQRVATVPGVGRDTEFLFHLPDLPLGWTPVTISSAAGEFTTATRFEVLPVPYQWDWGLGFQNPGVDTLTWTDYANAFGDDVYMFIGIIPVCCDRCRRQCHDPIAQLLWENYVRDMGQQGLCWGMCKQSIAYYHGDAALIGGQPVRDYYFDIDPDTEIARRVKSDHITQISAETIQHLLGHYDDTPVEVKNQIDAATSLIPPRPGIVSIIHLAPGGAVLSVSGHALVPDRVEQVGAEEWRIYVYDPNREDYSHCRDITDTSRYSEITDPNEYPWISVWVDGDVEHWSFPMTSGLWTADTRYSIDVSASGETFLEIPYYGMTYYPAEVVRGPHHMPLSLEGVFIILFGSADAGIEAAGNKRVGYDKKGRLYMEIEGAVPVVPMTGGQFPDSEAYALPSGDYRTTVYGREGGRYTWTAFGRGGTFSIKDALAVNGTEDTVDLGDSGRSLTFETSEPRKSYSVQIARRVQARSGVFRRIFEILDTTIYEGDTAVFETEESANSLVYENHGPNSIKFSARLSVASLGPQPEPPDLPAEPQPFEDFSQLLEGIEVPGNTALVLTPGDWDDLPGTKISIRSVPLDTTGTAFIRSDANDDGRSDISDAIIVLNYLFSGSPAALQCEKTGDANDDGAIDIADPVYFLTYRFSDGPAPPPPYPDCGLDPTPDGLSCQSFKVCQ